MISKSVWEQIDLKSLFEASRRLVLHPGGQRRCLEYQEVLREATPSFWNTDCANLDLMLNTLVKPVNFPRYPRPLLPSLLVCHDIWHFWSIWADIYAKRKIIEIFWFFLSDFFSKKTSPENPGNVISGIFRFFWEHFRQKLFVFDDFSFSGKIYSNTSKMPNIMANE